MYIFFSLNVFLELVLVCSIISCPANLLVWIYLFVADKLSWKSLHSSDFLVNFLISVCRNSPGMFDSELPLSIFMSFSKLRVCTAMGCLVSCLFWKRVCLFPSRSNGGRCVHFPIAVHIFMAKSFEDGNSIEFLISFAVVPPSEG